MSADANRTFWLIMAAAIVVAASVTLLLNRCDVHVVRDEASSKPTEPLSDRRYLRTSDGSETPGVDRELIEGHLPSDTEESHNPETEIWSVQDVDAVIRGIVVDDQKAPIAGATVVASSWTSEQSCPRSTTDGNGKFQIPITWSTAESLRMSLRVRAWKSGFEASEKTIGVKPTLFSSEALDHKFVLKAGRTVMGRVMSQGRPVAGARVYLYSGDLYHLYWTDGEGGFVGGWPAGKGPVDRIVAWHGSAGGCEVFVPTQAGPLLDFGDVELVRTSVVAFGLSFIDGQPAPGVTIELSTKDGEHGLAGVGLGAKYCRVRTGQGGEVVLYGMRPGGHYVSVLWRLPDSRAKRIGMVRSDGKVAQLTIEAVAVKVCAIYQGNRLGPGHVTTNWRQVVEGQEIGIIRHVPLDELALVERGSEWEIQIVTGDGSASGRARVRAEGSNVVEVSIALSADG